MENIVWLNTTNYTLTELILFFIGAICWVLCYVFIVRDIYRFKYVGIPAGVVGANFAWEFLWAFVFHHDMGMLIQIGYYGWFVLDCFIVANMFRYGYKQVKPAFQKDFNLYFGFSIAAWLVVLYFYIENKYDNPIGANSAYAIQLLISVTFVMLLLNVDKVRGKLNPLSNWLRMLGSLFCGIMCCMHWPKNTWIASMIVVYMIIDIYFLVKLYRKLAAEKLAPASSANKAPGQIAEDSTIEEARQN
jgi:hypothetical protein